jgi:hypothetical protein
VAFQRLSSIELVQVKEDEMGRACITNGKECIPGFGRKTEGKRCRWKDINMDCTEIGLEVYRLNSCGSGQKPVADL